MYVFTTCRENQACRKPEQVYQSRRSQPLEVKETELLSAPERKSSHVRVIILSVAYLKDLSQVNHSQFRNQQHTHTILL
jgi:hypothetical protein